MRADPATRHAVRHRPPGVHNRWAGGHGQGWGHWLPPWEDGPRQAAGQRCCCSSSRHAQVGPPVILVMVLQFIVTNNRHSRAELAAAVQFVGETDVAARMTITSCSKICMPVQLCIKTLQHQENQMIFAIEQSKQCRIC